ncbi:OLC1v1026053C1 [Oldenlandia corymbosa var. corymbosa]|uniref:OLC1v1026053C1 n=1 Tax=Oldenlandia corymbosa var. corymbosa TaxID=529605 RepID=A0AAV1C6N8_OLDCO|nr:OLC1v1026053C1 [Oldenlandia corymbosa var. corymbosa]
MMQVKTYTEVPAVSRSSSPDNFTVLIKLKAPDSSEESSSSRVPVDLVTVPDISFSMEGTKLALLKRAMGFVIENLGSNDRLSVVVFTEKALRVFPLSRMSESGKQLALKEFNRLKVESCTNISEGLRLGAMVMEGRRYKNPVSSVMFLSDGQDTHGYSNIDMKGNSLPRSHLSWVQIDYKPLVPPSIINEKILVFTFGFGSDHNVSLMHSVSEMSRGTFSFIETESVIQDAFAQCIGGLLSVAVKELQVNIECVDPRVGLRSLKSGSYPNQITPDGRMGNIDAGDLYAEEERDFLVIVTVPAETESSTTALLKVRCVYNNPLTKELVTVRSEEVKIRRPDQVVGQQDPCVEVMRRQNRLQVAEALALDAAEKGNLSNAATILGNCRKKLSESASAK